MVQELYRPLGAYGRTSGDVDDLAGGVKDRMLCAAMTWLNGKWV